MRGGAGGLEKGKVNYWRNGTFSQPNIDLSRLPMGKIRAKVDGRWQIFSVRQLPEDFLRWNFAKRIEMLENLKAGKSPSLTGPHSGMVASYGGRRRDSQFSINCAVKGIGFIPKEEKLDEVINLLKNTIRDSISQKISRLESLYQAGEEIFDLTKQTSLELYSTPDFETHTFLNQMANPAVAIVFLDFPSYELKALTQLIHPDNPKLTPYEKKAVEYINLVHDYFHSESPKKSIGVIYHIIEVFDNTPGKARGQRVVPPRS
ncbi:MAG: hypothetical protein ABIK97_06570 [candidate division WOR-3 bacterium]